MSTVPPFLQSFVDDAAIFPPATIPLETAVKAHRDHLSAPYAALVGPFVVSDLRLPDLLEIVSEGSDPLAVSVVVTGGAGAIEPAVRWATRSGLLEVRALETPLRDEDDLSRNAQRVVAAVDQVRDLLGEALVYVEPPRVHDTPGHGWLSALDEIASAELLLKFRTGGVDDDAFPTTGELAACIDAALDRELAFKCTAGLHHALRQAQGTRHQHGFLNVLAATETLFDGGSVDEAVALLEELDDPARVSERGRRWFRSFGCCAVEDPLEDLVELGLVQP